VQEEGDEGNVDALLRTPEATVNVFKMFNGHERGMVVYTKKTFKRRCNRRSQQ
jgi:hypothetical protein